MNYNIKQLGITFPFIKFVRYQILFKKVTTKLRKKRSKGYHIKDVSKFYFVSYIKKIVYKTGAH